MALRTSSDENTHLILNRPHTVLLLATMRDGYTKRGACTSALAAELRKADNKTDIHRMHARAATHLKNTQGETQYPELRSTLTKRLILPGSAFFSEVRYPTLYCVDEKQTKNCANT